MPADGEELAFALEDGVEFRELLAPLRLKDGILTCEQMALDQPDSSGRRKPVPTGATVEIPADTVITAIGDSADTELLHRFGIPTDKHGNPELCGETLESSLQGVYVVGDAVRGPATVAEAIAGAMKCVQAITGKHVKSCAALNPNQNKAPAYDKKGLLYCDCQSVHEPVRCLECATICHCCVDVCPNRANIAIDVGGKSQIVHIDSMCNECGNCEVFCPYSSAPYKEKFTLFTCEEDFENSENPGFLPLDGEMFRIRLDGETKDHKESAKLPSGIWELIQAVVVNMVQPV